uniref:Uncharacterized protein n=1 Tax=uncultured Muribaculaceae bacterium TaxID=2301481 RepID=A0A6G8F399_9BACT|nr:hypothetical protein Muribac1_0140 [uncultured Muribaculaceae bacterium]
MSEILIITGIVIALGATLVLLVFGIKQWHMRQNVKDLPMRYNEWLVQYKTKRGYILIAQLIGIIIGIIGLSI